MSETFLTIQETAEMTGKSIQTIRRAVKSKKVTVKKKRTPQGFNYLIGKDSILKYYKIQASLFEREAGGIKDPAKTKGLTAEFATIDDLKKFQKDIEMVLEEHKKEKESFMRFMKAFQERFVVMENQLKLLEQPKRHWYEFWR
jgi:hypothetical protein